MKKILVLILTFAVAASVSTAEAKTQRRHAVKRRSAASRVAAERSAAATKAASALNAGRARVTAQIKTLSHFLYLFGGIAKGIESADLAVRTRQASAAATDLGEQNKAKVRESIRNVRLGLEKLESDLRADPALRNYYPYVAGVADFGVAAENQAAANHFDDAGRSLLKAVDRLTDALAAMR